MGVSFLLGAMAFAALGVLLGVLLSTDAVSDPWHGDGWIRSPSAYWPPSGTGECSWPPGGCAVPDYSSAGS